MRTSRLSSSSERICTPAYTHSLLSSPLIPLPSSLSLFRYHAWLLEFGVKNYPYEDCWKDYMFQLILPTFRLLVMAPSLARDRKRRQGMFAPELSEASKKLSEMYVQLNTRLATALIDHDWPAQVEELKATGRWCCRPCS